MRQRRQGKAKVEPKNCGKKEKGKGNRQKEDRQVTRQTTRKRGESKTGERH